MKKKLKLTKNDGAATVEAVVGFTAFLFTVFTILNIVNICRAQAIISNAIDTTAKEMSQYSYFYQISGLNKLRKDASEENSVGKEKLNEVASGFDSLMGAVEDTQNSVSKTAGDIGNGVETIKSDLQNIRGNIDGLKGEIENAKGLANNVMDNPMDYLKYIIAVAGNTALDTAVSHYIAAPLAKSMTLKHFGEDPDSYLKSLGIIDGVEGLNFNMSTIFSAESPDEIHIVCVYKVHVPSLFKGLELDATCSKAAIARAWLGGDSVAETIEVSDDEKLSPKEDEDGQENSEDGTAETDPGASKLAEKTDIWALEGQLNNNNDARVMEFISRYNTYVKGATKIGAGTDTVIAQSGNGRTAYGMRISTNADTFDVWPDSVKKAIELSSDTGKNSPKIRGTNIPMNGLGPEETKAYHFTVFVPENMSSADKAKIEQKLTSKISEFKAQGLDFVYEVIPAGGTYSYPVE